MRLSADLFVALVFVVATSTYLSVDQHYTGFFVLLTCVLASLGYGLGTATAAMVWLARRCWRRAAASAIKGLVFFLLWRSAFLAGDYIHLALFYPVYRQQIETPRVDGDAPVRFFWGDKALWVTDGLQADTLVFDPTDALANSIGKVRDGSEPALGLATRHLFGHFYIEREFSR